MKNKSMLFLLAVLFVVLVGLSHSANKICCFVHPNYHGICTVTPGKGETCDSILKYLNTPNSAGKAYCNNTTLRVGWKEVSCSAK